jgi:hypothetical protein
MQFKEFIDNQDPPLILLETVNISKNLQYHIDKKISIHENIFRIYSKAYFDLINEARELYNQDKLEVTDEDAELLESDMGKTAEYDGEVVYLDAPLEEDEEVNEAEHNGEKVRLNKPTRTPGGPKKFKVYVKSGDKVKLVRFGDSKKSGLSIKNSSPARAKSFRARHKCSEKKDKTTAGYWSCNIGRYAKSVGLKSSKAW